MWPIDGERETEPTSRSGTKAAFGSVLRGGFEPDRERRESIDWAPVGFTALFFSSVAVEAFLVPVAAWKRHGGRTNVATLFPSRMLNSAGRSDTDDLLRYLKVDAWFTASRWPSAARDLSSLHGFSREISVFRRSACIRCERFAILCSFHDLLGGMIYFSVNTDIFRRSFDGMYYWM